MSSKQQSETQRQALLRTSIKAIIEDKSLCESERARKMQMLICSRSSQTDRDTEPAEPVATYSDNKCHTLGCQHYQLNAQLLAPCCNTWIACRFCHDESNTHTMDRFAVTQMKCMLCQEQQPIAQDCRRCKRQMGRYFCAKCRLIDDGPGKSIFHCDDCGICLSGKKSDFYHCNTCDACVNLDARTTHRCKEKQLHCDCPICGDSIFDSTQPVVQTECQHMIHERCLQRHIEYSFKCPICSASVCDTQKFFKSIEKYMSSSTMPPEYRDMETHIHCNDCRQRSVAKFHFIYHKCKFCRSYNTTILSTVTADKAISADRAVVSI